MNRGHLTAIRDLGQTPLATYIGGSHFDFFDHNLRGNGLTSSFDQLVPDRVAYEPGRRCHIEFSHDRRTMGFDRLYTQVEDGAHFLVAVPFSNELNDDPFACRE